MSQVSVPRNIPPRPRLDSVDWLRGFVMIVMALDHVRDFFGDVSFDAIDPHQTTIRHFFTRWVTHFCAPTFLFLTGIGIYLTKTRGRTKSQLSWFLLSRGAWLLVLELTYIRFFWAQFDLTYKFTGLGVFWSISWSMILMSLIVFLPDWLITVLGLAMILGHNALDGIAPADCGDWGPFWCLIHGHGDFEFAGMNIGTAYKILPWVGVMMAGYGFGRVLLWQREPRQRFIVRLGIAMIAAFIVLRGINIYGDRMPRLNDRDPAALAELAARRAKSIQEHNPQTVNPPLPTETFAALSCLNCEKYPPSLDYLLMTLGPALLLLAAADRTLGPVGRAVVTIGRVPLFFYLLHIAVIVPSATAVYRIGGALGWYGTSTPLIPASGLVPLWGVYVVWAVVIVILYLPCRWYADLKMRSRNPWLSYL